MKTQEQKDYIEAMERWFNNEENANNITRSNIENAKQMLKYYKIELANKKEQLEFDIARAGRAVIEYNKWCDDNDLSNYKMRGLDWPIIDTNDRSNIL